MCILNEGRNTNRQNNEEPSMPFSSLHHFSPLHATGRSLRLTALIGSVAFWMSIGVACGPSPSGSHDASTERDSGALPDADASVDSRSIEDGGLISDGAAARDGNTIQDGGSTADGQTFCDELDDPNELIADRRFRRGFIPLDQDTHAPSGVMPTGFCQESPIWDIAQWDSLGDLSQSTRETLPSGSVRWSNQYGSVTVGLLDNLDETDISFAVWAYQEYGGQYHTPTPDRVWVHLLAEQRISPPGVQRQGCPPLSALASLHFSMYAQLLKDEPHHQSGYDPNKHAAQFLLYFTVQNLNPNSNGFPDYLWFGITPYDDRYDIVPPYIQGDLSGAMGTGKLIYNLGGEPFITVGLTPQGPEQLFAKDILPDIRQALLEAWSRGYLPDSKVLSDYRIGGMNIGWEVPGLNDVEMRVRDLSLRYERRPVTPVAFEFNHDGDREGWTAVNMTDSNSGPTNGRWILLVPGTDPHLISPTLNLQAATHPTLHVIVANDHNPSASSVFQVYWERFGEPGFREAWSVSTPISNGGNWQTLDIDLSANPEWRGEITRIRIDPVQSGDNHSIGIDRIAL